MVTRRKDKEDTAQAGGGGEKGAVVRELWEVKGGVAVGSGCGFTIYHFEGMVNRSEEREDR